MIGIAPVVQDGLAERGYDVPVIDPPAAAVKLAEGLVDLSPAAGQGDHWLSVECNLPN